MQQDWTEEPWVAIDDGMWAESNRWGIVIDCWQNTEEGRSNVTRAVVCVNACAGVQFTGEPLGAVRDLILALDMAKDALANPGFSQDYRDGALHRALTALERVRLMETQS